MNKLKILNKILGFGLREGRNEAEIDFEAKKIILDANVIISEEFLYLKYSKDFIQV